MPSQYFDKVQAVTTAPGSASGFVTVAANNIFTVGAFAYILGVASSPAAQFCRITSLRGSTEVGLLFFPTDIRDPKLGTGVVKYPQYGRSDVSAYLTGSTLFQFAQPIDVNS